MRVCRGGIFVDVLIDPLISAPRLNWYGGSVFARHSHSNPTPFIIFSFDSV